MHHTSTIAQIVAMQEQFGTDTPPEEICRSHILPLVHMAYRAGKAETPGFPLDAKTEISACEKVTGPIGDRCKQFISTFVRCLNAAYAQGQRDTKGAAV